MSTPTIMVLLPKKSGDPTEYVSEWGEAAIKVFKNYNVVPIRGVDVTYDRVSEALYTYRPRVLISFSHGCPTSIIGQKECVVTRKFTFDELLSKPNYNEIVQPLYYQSGCRHTCKLEDPCSIICSRETNLKYLKDTVVIAVCCYTGSQLANCAVMYGVPVYFGYKNLLLFPTDDVKSEDIFKEVHLEFFKPLAAGYTVREAEMAMNIYETNMIKLYKKTKYIALPLVWNIKCPDSNGIMSPNRIILGNKDVKI